MADANTTTAALEIATPLTASFEGFRSAPYQDSVGVWTIGYGTTHNVDGTRITANSPAITEAQGQAMLAYALRNAASAIAHEVSEQLTLNQAAALEDFVYNLGNSALLHSTLLADINAGNFAAAAGEFDKWDHAGGVELAGLFRRRDTERKLFVTPNA